jgi:endoglucanase
MLFDGRNQAPKGWFVVWSLLPSAKTGEIIAWHIRLSVAPGWTRPPVVGCNQVGYTPDRTKVAMLELDRQCQLPTTARVLKLGPDGTGCFVEGSNDETRISHRRS